MNFNDLPDTVHRVQYHTSCKTNQKIRNETIERLNDFADYDDTVISQRIYELNQEWDTERVLEANAAALVLAGTMLGFAHKKCWFLLSGAVGCFLLKHALTGWCPPLPIIRKMGIRTSEEIYNEKTVLKEMRGDFSQITSSVPLMLEIAERQ